MKVKKSPKIAVVIGSGGIKSLGAIELFEFLDRAKIPLNLLVGCSGGAIIAAARGASLPMDKVREFGTAKLTVDLFNQIDYQALASIFHFPFTQLEESKAFLRSTRLRQTFHELYGDLQLEDLSIPTILQATDVHTGEPLRLSQGSVADSVYASSAILPFFPPIYMQDHWLADGAFTDSLPLMGAIQHQMDIIIALNFHDMETTESLNYMLGFSNFLKKVQAFCLNLQNASTLNLPTYKIIFIDVIFEKNIQIWEIENLPYIYQKTKEEVLRNEAAIIQAIEEFS
ncbi:Conserved hypothetical protein [Candidatus Protochlamydia naegleriophila]|uniref:PNPLA domain-containing protein n=1 Tax=Candidatus Protochlamydia naegleriophila TaxID=389348 RepID=A0A0U5CRK9_9BACT|nr:patatin-like phospholipase family protein [Candidatus Protochlamydia naegleriophila]CUI17628.1 Conserved hypothetical protein [Candidatus Protochlamydia naegleriophila]